MIPSNTIPEVCNYANAETALREMPSFDQISAGVMPLDNLPAAWWNCMWHDINQAVNCTRYTIESLVTEVNNVLAQANITVCSTCTDQLYQAIECIRRTVGEAYTAGSVRSGTNVSINGTTGIMTVNCLGNASSLTTASHIVVSAINELKSTYDGCLGTVPATLNTIDSTKARKDHRSTATTYGIGTASAYGHLKICNTYSSCKGGVAQGLAASQKAVSDMYNYFLTAMSGTKECALCWCSSLITCSSYPIYFISAPCAGYGFPYVLTAMCVDCCYNLNTSSLNFKAEHVYSPNIYTYPASLRLCNYGDYKDTCAFHCSDSMLYASHPTVACGNSTHVWTTLAYFACGPVPEQSARYSYAAWCNGVLYGQPHCGWAPSCAGSNLYGCAAKQSGQMVLNGWVELMLGNRSSSRPDDYAKSWYINGHQLVTDENASNWYTYQNSPAYTYRAWSNGCLNQAVHVHFNLYMNPLYLLNCNCTNASAYLGWTCGNDINAARPSSNYPWYANPYLQVVGSDGLGIGTPGYGRPLYSCHQLNSNCNSGCGMKDSATWLQCLSTIGRGCGAAQTIWYGLICCTSCPSRYFGTCYRAPMWRFYIES